MRRMSRSAVKSAVWMDVIDAASLCGTCGCRNLVIWSGVMGEVQMNRIVDLKAEQ